MRTTRRACALALLAIAGLVLALCLLPTGAVAEVVAEAGVDAADGAADMTAAEGVADAETATAGDEATTPAATSEGEVATEDVSAETASGGSGTVQIQYDTEKEIHYVPDADSANGRIILYCMNNASHWPHTTPSISNVPSYIEGYLTPE